VGKGKDLGQKASHKYRQNCIEVLHSIISFECESEDSKESSHFIFLQIYIINVFV
jgi:hypothetical protein